MADLSNQDQTPYNGLDVQASDIRAFRTSMSARRFPALRDLSDENVARLVSERDSPSKKVKEPPPEVTRIFQGRPTMTAKKNPKLPPFRPCNPSQAKSAISRQGDEMFVGAASRYDDDKDAFLTRKGLDEAKRLGPVPFAPNSATQAKTQIAVGYFLNSPHGAQASNQGTARSFLSMGGSELSSP